MNKYFGCERRLNIGDTFTVYDYSVGGGKGTICQFTAHRDMIIEMDSLWWVKRLAKKCYMLPPPKTFSEWLANLAKYIWGDALGGGNNGKF